MGSRILEYIRENKIFLGLMLLILASGIFIRFSDYTLEGYDEDSENVLAGATYWFYPPYKYFPGMIDQQPPLGDMIIGLGCMASGEDFSGVRNVEPLFFPNRAVLFGKAAVKAEKYCFFPVYLFGAIFLLIIAIIGSLMLEKPSALFFTAFFAYSPLIIKWSRLIHIDSILWVFVALGLLFLWLGYQTETNTKKERLMFILSFGFFGLAGATKFTAGLFFIFAPLIFLDKYRNEARILAAKLSKALSLNLWERFAQENINAKMAKTFLLSMATMAIAFLAPFKFNPKNFISIYNAFTQMNRPGSGKAHLTFNFFKGVYYHIIKMNLIESILLAFAVYMLIRMILKKEKDKLERFILCLIALQFIALTLFEELTLGIGGIFRAVPFMMGMVLLMSLAVSNKEYSIISLLKPSKKKVYAAIAIFIIYSATTAYSAPYFQRHNELVCILSEKTCAEVQYRGGQGKASAEALKSMMTDNENYWAVDIDPAINYYLHPENAVDTWNMIVDSTNRIGRRPTIEEYRAYFSAIGKPIRYVLLPEKSDYEDRNEFMKKYTPNRIVEVNGREVSYIYDLQNLQPR